MTIKAKFKGTGASYLNGVPARDLTVEEYDALDAETRAAVDASELYKVAGGGDTDAAAKPEVTA